MIPTFVSHNRDFLYGPRGFTNVDEMNHTLVKIWNKVIDPEDEVYHLGDVMLNNNEEGARLLHQLNGLIHIILGNHDTDERAKIYKSSHNVVEVCYGRPLRYQGYHFYLSHYPTLTSNFDFDKPLKSRLINLCGHSHTTDPFMDWKVHNAPIYHCELDAHDCKPISIDEALKDICSYNANLKR